MSRITNNGRAAEAARELERYAYEAQDARDAGDPEAEAEANRKFEDLHAEVMEYRKNNS